MEHREALLKTRWQCCQFETEDVPKFFLFWFVQFEEKKKVFPALLRRRERLQILNEWTEIVRTPQLSNTADTKISNMRNRKYKSSISLPAQVLLPKTASTQHCVPYLIPPSVAPPVQEKKEKIYSHKIEMWTIQKDQKQKITLQASTIILAIQATESWQPSWIDWAIELIFWKQNIPYLKEKIDRSNRITKDFTSFMRFSYIYYIIWQYRTLIECLAWILILNHSNVHQI